jgi:hypothetical protein
MRECDLYPPVRDWLKSQGYTVYIEIFDADIVAVKDNQLTAVELKACLTKGLRYQCIKRSYWADWVIAVVASKPKDARDFQHHGFGLYQLKNGKLKKIYKPRQQPLSWQRSHAYRVKRLSAIRPASDSDVAGLPCCERMRLQRDAK